MSNLPLMRARLAAGRSPYPIIRALVDRAVGDRWVSCEERRAGQHRPHPHLSTRRAPSSSNPSAVEFFDALIKLHPARLNPGMLWRGATMLLRSPANA